MAEDAARELPNLPPEDALQLVHLYAERGSPKYEKAALRWLQRYLDRGHAEAPALRGGCRGPFRAGSARGALTNWHGGRDRATPFLMEIQTALTWQSQARDDRDKDDRRECPDAEHDQHERAHVKSS